MRKSVFLALLTFPAMALAAGGEGHGALEKFWKAFNIVLFLAIVYWVARKPVGEAFNNFWRKLTEDVDRSEQELALAKSELRKAKEELEKAKVKADESVALTRESADAEIKRAREHALEVAERIKEKAQETVEIELKRAKEELSRFGMQKAEEIAKEMLRDAFRDPSLQKRYIEGQLKVLEDRKNDR
jgi:F-type H+-transporting ATPase subunit b